MANETTRGRPRAERTTEARTDRADREEGVDASEEEELHALGKAAAFGTELVTLGSPGNTEGIANGTLTSKGHLGGPAWPREDGYAIAVPAAGATNASDLKRLEGTPAMEGRSELAKAADAVNTQTDPRTGSGPKGPEHGVGPSQDEEK